MTSEAPVIHDQGDTAAFSMLFVGAMLLALGVILLLNPVAPVELSALDRAAYRIAEVDIPRVVNLQRLAWAISSSVAGAVFFVGGLLPFTRLGRR